MSDKQPLLLLIDLPASGAWNMAVDEALLEAAATGGQSTLRFYQWRQPTLSLGYFQSFTERDAHPPSLGCPVVRRISGGGAILHHHELTYSLTIANGRLSSGERNALYRVVHESLIAALSNWKIKAYLVTCGYTDEASPCSRKGEKQPFLCFQRRARGDVLVEEIKIAGSAQRRLQGAILQHGSVLLARSRFAPELDGLKERTGAILPAEELIQAWLAPLAEDLRYTWQIGELPQITRQRAEELAAKKYALPDWTKKL